MALAMVSWQAPNSASAQSTPPIIAQLIRSEAPIYNHVGKTLLGNEPSREDLGLDYVRGNRIEILSAPNGIIYPPLKDGQNDPRNPLLHVTYIGYGMDPLIETPGMFAISLTPRPPDGTKIFARAFNNPSLEISSFYSDSQLYTVSWVVDTPFVASFPHTSNPLDADDNDNDGLSNSWERWNGSNPNLADTDGDGLDDLAELQAGTNPDDWESYLQIVNFHVSNNVVVVEYMAGKDSATQIQASPNFETFGPRDPVTAQTNDTQGIITAVLPADNEPTSIIRLGVPVNEL